MLIIEWSFSLQFQHTHFQFTAAMWASQRHGLCMISSHICISQQCLYGFILLAWSPEAIKVSKQIAPWHYTKRKRGEISGSQTKRIPYRCHEVSQEHNCFWALICFSAATKGGKGVILVNVSVHRPFVLLVMAQLETQGRRGCTKGKVIISWPPILYHGKKPFTTSACSYRQTPWFSFQYGCQVF